MPKGKGTYGSKVGRPPKKKYYGGGNVDPFSQQSPESVPFQKGLKDISTDNIQDLPGELKSRQQFMEKKENAPEAQTTKSMIDQRNPALSEKATKFLDKFGKSQEKDSVIKNIKAQLPSPQISDARGRSQRMEMGGEVGTGVYKEGGQVREWQKNPKDTKFKVKFPKQTFKGKEVKPVPLPKDVSKQYFKGKEIKPAKGFYVKPGKKGKKK